jgi:uncharacterized membrane protein YvbJ|tara:strand:- start:296 stop:481 length:186 start_codon:yes stop_codon:yes gene_type:complete
LAKVHLGSTKIQSKFEKALASNDKAKIKQLMAESISETLEASLTKQELNILENIYLNHENH